MSQPSKPFLLFDDFQKGKGEALALTPEGYLTLNPEAWQLCPRRPIDLEEPYYCGRWTSPVVEVPFEEAIASWEAVTPPGTWVEILFQARTVEGWTGWYSMGLWHDGGGPFPRTSLPWQGDAFGRVETDTLILFKEADALRLQAMLYTADPSSRPLLRQVAVTFAPPLHQRTASLLPAARSPILLEVPPRSQMVYPDGGEAWCSPTSTSMVMAYWAKKKKEPRWDLPVPEVVKGVWDEAYGGAGNWSFNTAFAASLGLSAQVARFSSLDELEAWIRAGIPAVISAAWREGELPGAPISRTGGHLLVVRGFDEVGDVLALDPAGATDEEVPRTYPRSILERLWLRHSKGTAYLIYPPDWRTP
ncbi:MAG: C39 family peptidase [Clostridiales bacterium]|nr:C39 family peptidase [Clostridiales bacterium]